MSKEAEVVTRILVDHRERASRVPQLLGSLGDCQIDWATLPHGDFEVEGKLIIERKAAADFVASIIDRRLFSQVERIADAGIPHTVLIEGDPYTGRLHNNAIAGAISWLVVIAGVSVVSSSSQQQSAALIHTMARHAVHGLGYEVNLHPPKPKSPTDLARYLVESLPGVGGKTAEALLRYFGSARAVLAADEAALLQVPGVGKSLASKIQVALDTRIR